MQSLEVISINIWQMLISLCNLLILYLLLKKFLYGPVRKMLAKRDAEVTEQYQAAEQAKADAEEKQAAWTEKMQSAKAEADDMITRAAATASARGESIIAEATDKADSIVRQAKTDAALEKKKAEAEIRQEIIDISSLMTEKMLQRELKAEDHKAMIDSFLDEIGEADGGDK